MRTVIPALALAFAASAAQAQSLEEKLDAKLKEGWITKSPWITDFDQARAEAKKNGKVIFAYFTRSYSP